MRNGILRKEVLRRGGAQAVAEALGVTAAAVYYWMNGNRQPSDRALEYLGLKRVQRIVKRARQRERNKPEMVSQS